MNNVTALKKKSSPWPVIFAYATVSTLENRTYRVVTADGQDMAAQKAAGCLLVPEIGDRILLACDEAGEGFIMEVLVKARLQAEVVIPGEATIRSENGGLHLRGQTITIAANEQATVAAPALSFSGVVGEARFLSFSLMAKTLGIRSKQASAIIDTLDTVCGRLTERIQKSFRRIEDLEEVKAGRLRTIVRERFALRAKQASIQAEEEVAIDGKKIHLG